METPAIMIGGHSKCKKPGLSSSLRRPHRGPRRLLNATPLVDPNTPAGVMPVSGGSDWILDFSDEFSGATLNATKWGIDVSTSSRAARTDRGIDDWWWRHENVTLDGAGNLKLDVVKHDTNTMYCGSVSSDGKYEPLSKG